MFEKNVGTLDRGVRMLVGLLLMWYGYDHESWWGLLGVVVLATGVFGTCGLYGVVWSFHLLGEARCTIEGHASRGLGFSR